MLYRKVWIPRKVLQESSWHRDGQRHWLLTAAKHKNTMLLACWLMPSFSSLSSYTLQPHCLSVTKQRRRRNICEHTHPPIPILTCCQSLTCPKIYLPCRIIIFAIQHNMTPVPKSKQDNPKSLLSSWNSKLQGHVCNFLDMGAVLLSSKKTGW